MQIYVNVFVKICLVMGSVDDDFNEACNTWIENSLPAFVDRAVDPLRDSSYYCSQILGHPPSFCDDPEE